ncbi:MAG: phosphatase PAP2 family protein [Blastocatellia bacterium]|nr:phosphatase PAP2 family protein [Blastocatellia bacterium]
MTISDQPVSTAPSAEETPRLTVKSVLRRIRLGEYLAVGWIGFVLSIHLWQGSSIKNLFQGQFAFPFFIPFFIILCRHLVPLLWTAIRKLSWTVELSTRGGESRPALRTALNFSSELESGRKLMHLCRDAAPLYVFGLFYPMTDFVLRVLRGDKTYDALLSQLDLLIFRCHLSVWSQQFITPGLSEYLSLCYFLHGIIALIIVFFVGLFHSRVLLVEAMQGFILISMIGFVLYILVPGVGPMYSLAALYTQDITGGPMTQANFTITDMLRAHRDVFPSLHVAISGLMLVYAWRANRIFACVMAPLILGNWVSTIYLRYHYTVDVVVALLLIPAVYFTVQWWVRTFPESMAVATKTTSPMDTVDSPPVKPH